MLTLSNATEAEAYLKTIGDYASVDCSSFAVGTRFMQIQNDVEVVTKQIMGQ